jgi:hypothetical protein
MQIVNTRSEFIVEPKNKKSCVTDGGPWITTDLLAIGCPIFVSTNHPTVRLPGESLIKQHKLSWSLDVGFIGYVDLTQPQGED